MPLHDYKCPVCGLVFEAGAAWDEYEVACPTLKHLGAHCSGRAERIYGGANIIDDTLPGGARYMHNLGDQPIWVEKKSELNRLMQERGLVQAERSTYNRDDKSPYATKTRLRPGQRDPFMGAG